MLKRKAAAIKANRNFRITRYIVYKETAINISEQFWSFIGAFIGIGLIAFLQSLHFSRLENVFLIGSFGATSVLVFGAIQSPLAQPRNLIGGQLISAFIGVSVFKIFPDVIWVTAPLAVSLSIVVMQITRTLHPPGGATALIAVIGTSKITSLGYFYVLFPVLGGTIILFVIALIFNNLTRCRQYPTNEKLTRVFKTKGIDR
ncbi:HPP family protein [Postechiella marina]|uniref:HPP family protein n=1 Tax=Postechiella marina TaxID=943941 RepID=A0ABP8CCF0_9FLAO